MKMIYFRLPSNSADPCSASRAAAGRSIQRRPVPINRIYLRLFPLNYKRLPVTVLFASPVP